MTSKSSAMRVKQAVGAGFKTFADPQKLLLPYQLTVIVGPNGCGKSNIVDGFQFVLGESSPKVLRGSDSTDLIFHGSTSRRAATRASFELIFENCEGRLRGSLAARHEVSVKRVITDDGKSQYYLNGEKCRKKDVTQLFLGTGLGPRSYAIIGQGTIARLIESKPEELRVFIEEAAGISKYKEQRKETENLLNSTELNLGRLDDIIHEIDNQLEKLEKDAEKAKRYKVLKAEQRELKAELAYLKYLRFMEAFESAKSVASNLEKELASKKVGASTSQDKIGQFELRIKSLQVDIEETMRKVYEGDAAINSKQQEIVHEKERSELRSVQIDKIKLQREAKDRELSQVVHELSDMGQFDDEELVEIEKELQEEEQRLSSDSDSLVKAAALWEAEVSDGSEKIAQKKLASSRLDMFERELVNAQNQLGTAQKELGTIINAAPSESVEALQDSLDSKRDAFIEAERARELKVEEYTKLQSAINAKSGEYRALEKDIADKNSRLSSLNYIQSKESSANKAFKKWLGKSNIEATRLIEHLSMDSDWSRAAESVLGWLGDPFVAEPMPDIGEGFRSSWAELGSGPKVPGSLAEQVSSVSYPLIFNYIGAGQDIGTAFFVEKTGALYGKGYRISGELSDSGFFDRATEIESLDKSIASEQLQLHEVGLQLQEMKESLQGIQSAGESCRDAVAELKKDIAVLESQISGLERTAKEKAERKQRLEAVIAELGIKVTNCQQKLEEQSELVKALEGVRVDQGLIDDLKLKKEALEKSVKEARFNINLLKENKHDLEMASHKHIAKFSALNERKAALIVEVDNLQCELDSELEASYGDSDKIIAGLESEVEALVIQKSETEQALGVFRKQQLDVTNEKAELEQRVKEESEGFERLSVQINERKIEMERAKTKAETHIEELKDMRLDLVTMAETLPCDANERKWSDRLAIIGKKVAEIGSVNLASIEEFDEVQKRKKELEKQVIDVRKSVDELRSAIAKIDNETRERFGDTFTRVNQGLQELFPKVFGGGSADLELTEENLLTAGVRIMARPPGKKNSSIQMLSGGEKALTALCLVFSIFQLNPAPFCILDEVDAPLDAVNVIRFSNLVKSMSDSVQFIVISHKKGTMEVAEQMTGVTMREPGVSKLVSVSMSEAEEMAAKNS